MRYDEDLPGHLVQGVYDSLLSFPRALVITRCGWYDRASIRFSAATLRTMGLLALSSRAA